MHVLTSILFIFLFSPSNMVIAAGAILPPPAKISDHVYAWIGPLEGPNKENQGYRMNMAFVVGKKSVAVIDTGYTEAMAKEMLQHIKTITRLPIRYAINTNSQPHRFMGNSVFKRAGAKLISHPKEVKRMRDMSGVFSGAIEFSLGLPKDSVIFPDLPETLIEKDKSFDLGGVHINIQLLGASHTPASFVVYIPEDNIVYAGDILYSGRLLAVLPDSNIKGWIATFNKLKQFANATFIPGHGQAAKLKAFEFPTLSYLNLLHTFMKKSVDQGLDIQEAMKKIDQSAYKHLVNFDQLAGRNASWAYLEAESASFE